MIMIPLQGGGPGEIEIGDVTGVSRVVFLAAREIRKGPLTISNLKAELRRMSKTGESIAVRGYSEFCLNDFKILIGSSRHGRGYEWIKVFGLRVDHCSKIYSDGTYQVLRVAGHSREVPRHTFSNLD